MKRINIALVALLACFLAMAWLVSAEKRSNKWAREQRTEQRTARTDLDRHTHSSSSIPKREPKEETPSAASSSPGSGSSTGQPGGAPSLTEALANEDFEEEYAPTAEGLYAITTALWSNPDFLSLTEEEARALFPLDHDVPGYPTSLGMVSGGMPSIDECKAAMRDANVSAACGRFYAADLKLSVLAEFPDERRGQEYEAFFNLAKSQRQEAGEALMAELDKVSSYKNWRLMWRLYEEWSK